jgi:hypothetical protein
MADPSLDPDTRDEPDAGPDREPIIGPPLWVKVVGLIALVLVVLLVVVLLIGGGEHGPGRHSLGAGDGATQRASGPDHLQRP